MPYYSGGTEVDRGHRRVGNHGHQRPLPLDVPDHLCHRNLLSALAGARPETFENIGSHRALAGVRKANLSYKGTAWGDPGSDYFVEHRYWGVICP